MAEDDNERKLDPKTKAMVKNALGVAVVVVSAVVTAFVVDMFVEKPKSVESEASRRKKQAFLDVAKSTRSEDEQSTLSEDWESVVSYSRQAAKDGKNIDQAIDKINNIHFSLTDEEKTDARDELDKLNSTRDREAKTLLDELAAKAEKLIKEKQFGEAADLYQNYSPPPDKEYLARATQEERVKLANEYYNKSSALKEKSAAVAQVEREKRQQLLDSLSEVIVRGRFNDALKLFMKKQETNKNPKLEELLTQLNDAEHNILESFKKDIDKIIVVEHHGKKQRVKIKRVSNMQIQAEDKVGKIKVGVKFEVDDLSLEERRRRLRTVDLAPRNIYLGVNALREGDNDAASKYFKDSGPFSECLLARCSAVRKKKIDGAAKSGMIHLLKTANVKEKTFDVKKIVAQLSSATFSSGQIKRLTGMIASYQMRFDGCEFYESHKGVITALNDAIERSKKNIQNAKPKVVVTMKPKKPTWSKKVRSKEDLFRALKSFNPDYDLKGEFKTTGDGDIVEVSLSGAKINDVTPLRGLDLTMVDVSGTSVANIAPLKRMPLKSVNLADTKVLDLQPLRWSKELTSLDIINTPVVDLTPLRNLELKKLAFDPKKIQGDKSFETLRNMKSLATIKTPKGEESAVKFWIRYDNGEYKK